MERLNINQLNQSAIQFEGVYRVSSCRSLIARTGKSYMRLILEDATGTMTGYEWRELPSGERYFDDGSHLHIRGRSRYYNDSFVVDITSSEQISPTPEQGIITLPFSQCPKPEALSEFAEILLNIEHNGLRGLLTYVFSQEKISLPFIQVPASLKYHHNYQSGLLVHSVECARIIQDLSIFPQQDRELGITAALLHDLGKIKTIGINFSRPELGKAIDHDAITLELCASALAKLDMDYPELGIDLRHILTCRSTRRWGYEPKLAIAHAVQLADRLSSDKSLQTVFSSHEKVQAYQIASLAG